MTGRSEIHPTHSHIASVPNPNRQYAVEILHSIIKYLHPKSKKNLYCYWKILLLDGNNLYLSNQIFLQEKFPQLFLTKHNYFFKFSDFPGLSRLRVILIRFSPTFQSAYTLPGRYIISIMKATLQNKPYNFVTTTTLSGESFWGGIDKFF